MRPDRRVTETIPEHVEAVGTSKRTRAYEILKRIADSKNDNPFDTGINLAKYKDPENRPQKPLFSQALLDKVKEKERRLKEAKQESQQPLAQETLMQIA